MPTCRRWVCSHIYSVIHIRSREALDQPVYVVKVRVGQLSLVDKGIRDKAAVLFCDRTGKIRISSKGVAVL